MKANCIANVLHQSYTIEEILEMKNGNRITGVVVVDFNSVVGMDLNFFTDYISYKLIGDNSLMDVGWCVVGTDENHDLLIEVSGDVSMFLELIEAWENSGRIFEILE